VAKCVGQEVVEHFSEAVGVACGVGGEVVVPKGEMDALLVVDQVPGADGFLGDGGQVE